MNSPLLWSRRSAPVHVFLMVLSFLFEVIGVSCRLTEKPTDEALSEGQAPEPTSVRPTGAEHLAKVRGVVTASDTGLPVPEYFLQLKEQESEDTHISSKVQRIKSPAGTFLLEGLKLGTYRLGVKAKGYAIHWQEVLLGAGKEEKNIQ